MTPDATGAEPFADRAGGGPEVRGTLHRPARPPRAALVLTHGAGSNAEAPLLVALAMALAAHGLLVLRCDLPFRQASPTGPPSPRGAPHDRDGLRGAVRALRPLVPGPLLLGGHSYGGRQATIAAAEDPALADGLLLLAYPLHPPGRADAARTAHFPAIRTPAQFVHGTRDPFGSIEALGRALALIPAPTALRAIAGAGHDLRVRRTAAPFDSAVDAASAACLDLLPG